MLIKATQAVCRKCKYRMKSNSGYGYMCNYLAITGHARAFDDQGNLRLPQGYCDCFEKGKAAKTGWTTDDITIYTKKKEYEMNEIEKCKYAGWCVINNNDDRDYVCRGNYYNRECRADKDCKYYKPEKENKKGV